MTRPKDAKLLRSLHLKKARIQSGLFLVEGEKAVLELCTSGYRIQALYLTKEFQSAHRAHIPNDVLVVTVDPAEISALGTLEVNTSALAVAYQQTEVKKIPSDKLIVVLDDIRDPGNLGTIIRIADWYGVSDIVCSPTCVDWYNPKVIMATMGSFTRVKGHTCELTQFLKNYSGPIYGAFLEGESIRTVQFPKAGVLIIGNESHGISKEVAKCISHKITIPRFGKAESLNAAIATAVILDRWRS